MISPLAQAWLSEGDRLPMLRAAFCAQYQDDFERFVEEEFRAADSPVEK